MLWMSKIMICLSCLPCYSLDYISRGESHKSFWSEEYQALIVLFIFGFFKFVPTSYQGSYVYLLMLCMNN